MKSAIPPLSDFAKVASAYPRPSGLDKEAGKGRAMQGARDWLSGKARGIGGWFSDKISPATVTKPKADYNNLTPVGRRNADMRRTFTDSSNPGNRTFGQSVKDKAIGAGKFIGGQSVGMLPYMALDMYMNSGGEPAGDAMGQVPPVDAPPDLTGYDRFTSGNWGVTTPSYSPLLHSSFGSVSPQFTQPSSSYYDAGVASTPTMAASPLPGGMYSSFAWPDATRQA